MPRERAPLSTPPAPPHRLLVVGGGPFQLDMIRTAKQLGCFVAVADRREDAPGMLLADAKIAIDTTDVDALVGIANDLEIDGVVTAASDAAVNAVAAIGAARKLRAVPPAAAARCHDKLATFEALPGGDMPETIAIHDRASLEAIDRVGGFPLVIKPRSAAGGRGVCVVGRAENLDAAITRARRYERPGEGILIQRFVRGRPIGVEAFFSRAKLATAFVMDDQFESGFVSPIGHAMPTTLDPEHEQKVIEDVMRFASALELHDGPANFDLRIENGRTVLLEVNARLGGNSITDLVRSCWGVDLSAATIRASLGFDPSPELERRAPTPTACRLILKRGEGRAFVQGVLRSLKSREGVLAIDLTVRDGEEVSMRVDEHAVLGRALVTANDPAAAIERARTISEELAAAIELRPA